MNTKRSIPVWTRAAVCGAVLAIVVCAMGAFASPAWAKVYTSGDANISELQAGDYVLGGVSLKNDDTGKSASIKLNGGTYVVGEEGEARPNAYDVGAIASNDSLKLQDHASITNGNDTLYPWASNAKGNAWQVDSKNSTSDSTDVLLKGAKVYTVTPYDNSDGTVGAEPTSAYEGDTVKLTPEPATDYELKSITVTKSDGTGNVDVVDNAFTMPASDVTVTAVFEKKTPETYTVTFNKNADGATGTMENQTLTEGEATTLNENKFKYEDHSFVEWNTKPDGSGDKYADKATIDSPSANLELYAQWSSNKATLKFDPNGGEGSMDDLSVTKNETTKLPDNQFTRSGYTFSYWNLAADGSGSGNIRNGGNVSVKRDATLYAQWTKYPTMTSDAGGNFISKSKEVTFTISQEVPVNASYMRINTDLEAVMSYTSSEDEVVVRVKDGDTISDAMVTIDGQTLSVVVDNEDTLAALRDKTVEVVFKAKVKSGADLSSYLNSAKTTASIPYKAYTDFQFRVDKNDPENTSRIKVYVESATKNVKVAVSSNNNNTNKTTTAKTTSAKKTSTLAKTGDYTTMVPIILMVAVGVAAVVVGRMKRH